ncbi:MAG: putative CAMK family protein kinase [Streblomastix strix]|uniref:non-specific serine/threonine protein kinase n=1 Tax=Streblomastix strix TaxID=222440 RepID=A0A5J4UZB0_9EUKA|nr:MAG: putative CAMK family protein kinase [Streblomastix strix]
MADQALLDEYKDRVETPSAPLLTLADFTNIKLLSEGGYGYTYTATFQRTGQEIVLKQFKVHNEAQEQAINREIEIHKNMQFRFIAQFIDHFREGAYGQIIVMEYYKKGDLQNFIKTLKNKRELADENFVWDVIAQLVMSVGFLHSQRVIHRDIKPENVFLSQYLESRLGDFGLSKVLDAQLSYAKSMIGTFRYVSPELLQEEKFHKSGDVWGIGVTIYELLTQHRPFDGRTNDELQKQIVYENPAPIPTHYSQELIDLTMKMLIKNRFLRISINQLVKEPKISQRIKAYAREMIGGVSQESAQIQYLLEKRLIQKVHKLNLSKFQWICAL